MKWIFMLRMLEITMQAYSYIMILVRNMYSKRFLKLYLPKGIASNLRRILLIGLADVDLGES